MARFALTSTALFGSLLPTCRLVRRIYGSGTARRFARAGLFMLGIQQVFVAEVLRRRPNPRGLGLIDLMTLSRGAVSAHLLGFVASGVRDRRGPAGWFGWCGLVYGAIVCDWLDGPLARRTGTSDAGMVFDLEADSWLTLSTAAAAVTWGDLPSYTAIPAFLRYPLFLAVVHRSGYGRATAGDPPWARRVGIAQMALFLAALAPFKGRVTQRAARVAAPVETIGQVAALALLFRRKLAA